MQFFLVLLTEICGLKRDGLFYFSCSSIQTYKIILRIIVAQKLNISFCLDRPWGSFLPWVVKSINYVPLIYVVAVSGPHLAARGLACPCQVLPTCDGHTPQVRCWCRRADVKSHVTVISSWYSEVWVLDSYCTGKVFQNDEQRKEN